MQMNFGADNYLEKIVNFSIQEEKEHGTSYYVVLEPLSTEDQDKMYSLNL